MCTAGLELSGRPCLGSSPCPVKRHPQGWTRLPGSQALSPQDLITSSTLSHSLSSLTLQKGNGALHV